MSLGLDYRLGAQTVRPKIGVAYLDDDIYGDLSLDYDLDAKGVDFGMGLGGWGN